MLFILKALRSICYIMLLAIPLTGLSLLLYSAPVIINKNVVFSLFILSFTLGILLPIWGYDRLDKLIKEYKDK